MGSSNGISRGQLRPHFSSGRSPPLLMATLLVGIGILGVSYWSLSNQYNSLENQLRKMIQEKETLKTDENFIQHQLHLREDAFSKAQKQLQDKEQEIQQLNVQIKNKDEELNSLNTEITSIKETYAKCGEELGKKSNEIGDFNTRLNELNAEKVKIIGEKDALKQENNELKKDLELSKKQVLSHNVIPKLPIQSNQPNLPQVIQVVPQAQSSNLKTDDEILVNPSLAQNAPPNVDQIVNENEHGIISAKDNLKVNPEAQINESSQNRVLEAPKPQVFPEAINDASNNGQEEKLSDANMNNEVNDESPKVTEGGLQGDLVESDKKNDALMDAAAAADPAEGADEGKDNDQNEQHDQEPAN